jgi:hypothetical protein
MAVLVFILLLGHVTVQKLALLVTFQRSALPLQGKVTLVSTYSVYPFSVANRKWSRKIDLNRACEISSSHGGEYDVQSCLLGCTAV